MAKVFLTGAAGFIGFHTAVRLTSEGHEVVGLDNLNDYYPPSLKLNRLKELDGQGAFRFVEGDLADASLIARLFQEEKFSHVVHLGAQAGVRYSLENPSAYIQSNVVGTLNILEGCRHHPVEHCVYASSSSVYGLNTKMPFSEEDPANHPVSLYAATKKSNELMAHSYSHLYGMATTGLRFFTVYGPWGRPDMAPMLFAKAISEGTPIKVFNHGRMKRDFTFVDDIVDGVVRTTFHPAASDPAWNSAAPDPATSSAPYRVYNIGNRDSVELLRFIEVMEDALGKKAEKIMMDMQPGDVVATYASVDRLGEDTGFAPTTPIEVGIPRFVEWYRAYYAL
ncbi:NAD-dependent epimerase [soil metagenome]